MSIAEKIAKTEKAIEEAEETRKEFVSKFRASANQLYRTMAIDLGEELDSLRQELSLLYIKQDNQ